MGSIPIGTAYSISMELVQIQQRRQPVKGKTALGQVPGLRAYTINILVRGSPPSGLISQTPWERYPPPELLYFIILLNKEHVQQSFLGLSNFYE